MTYKLKKCTEETTALPGSLMERMIFFLKFKGEIEDG